MKFYLSSLNNSTMMKQKITYLRDQKKWNILNGNHLYFQDVQNY